MNKFLIDAVSVRVYAQERAEGDFRYQHIRVRTNAEPIAFYGGERHERKTCDQLLGQLISTQLRLILHQFFLKIWINLCDYLGSILSFIALAVPLFAGVYNNLSPADLSRLISQNAFVTIYLINCFTRLIDLASLASIFFGTAQRITELLHWFGLNRSSSGGDQYSLQEIIQSDHSDGQQEDEYFECESLEIASPPPPPPSKGRRRVIILSRLSFTIQRHQSLLITGPSGVGKTALLRMLKHIWPIGAGGGHIRRYISVDDVTRVMFVPQKPLLTTGSIAEQIVYPLFRHNRHNQHYGSITLTRINTHTQLILLSTVVLPISAYIDRL